MKYAITGPRGRIFKIVEAATANTIELTTEQSDAATALMQANKPAILVDGRVTNHELEREGGNILRWSEELNALELTPFVPPVPSSITAWQAKAGLAMTAHTETETLLEAAEAALNAMPEGVEKIVVLSAWNNNANFERTGPTILSFGTALGMTSDDLDNLFRLGGSLTV